MPPKRGGKKNDQEPEPLKPEDSGYDKEELKVKVATHEMRILRLREENQKLREVIDRLQQEKDATATATQDVVKHLMDRLGDNEKHNAKLRQDIAAQEDERKAVEQELNTQMEQMRDDWQREEETLRAEISDAKARLDSVEEFKKMKDAMTRDIETLRQQVEDRQARHKEDVDRLREQHREEREKLRGDMVNKWRKTRLQVYKLTEDHLQTKTQQTIQENERLTRELDVYARECREMMCQNESLVEARGQAKRALELSEKMCEELMKKNQHQQRAIRSLVGQLKQVEQRTETREQQSGSEQHLQVQALNETVDKQYEIVIDLKREADELRSELKDTQAALALGQREAVMQQASLSEARAFLLQCMDDARRSLAPAIESAEDSIPPPAGRELQCLSPRSRMDVVEYLCRRMEAFDSGFYPSAPAVASGVLQNTGATGKVPRGGSGRTQPRIPAPPSASGWGPLVTAPRPKPANGKEVTTTPGEKLPVIPRPPGGTVG
eukprot:Hpha_TRINITY_DN9825_c0_g2::TRINITY_DN9825_c0_g2_i1::g.81541::m.81541